MSVDRCVHGVRSQVGAEGGGVAMGKEAGVRVM